MTESWQEHSAKAHPKEVWKVVRNLIGTRFICCVGDCKWEGKRG